MSEVTVDQAIQIALNHQRAGELAEAEEIFRQILDVYPDQADALHLLGGVYLQANKLDRAEERLRAAIAARPREPAFKLTLGVTLQSAQRVAEAVELYRQVVGEVPEFTEGWVHLGVAQSLMGRFEDAAVSFQEALKRSPSHVRAQGNLGIVLCHLRRFDEAILVLRAAIALAPKEADFHASLGAALYFKAQLEAAMAACKEAVALDPNQGQATNILALALRDLGRYKESVEYGRRAAALLPNVVEVQVNYGEGLRATGDLDGTAAHYRECLRRIPGCADFVNNLGNVLKDQGMLDEALAEFRRSLALRMDPAILSNLIYTMQYHPASTPEMVHTELQRFNAAFVRPLARARKPHDNDRDPERRLRVGYISTEFRQHALGLNLLPLLAAHDKTQFEVFCYADVLRPDFYTYRIRQCADHWEDVHCWSDEAIAEAVRRDKIDVLIELHQHIAGGKLLVYARKPAPVQIAFAGYPGSSGLETMDHRLTDPYLEPDGKTLQPATEETLWLPKTWWCYHPVADVPVTPLPALANGYVTFGNLNNFCKLNEQVFAVWAEIMRALPGSRLIMLTADGSHRERTKGMFARLGIGEERIQFVERQSAPSYFKMYNQIDLTVDSFPCNGHTTSMDSFFMGVPVTTLVTDRLWCRATWSQLCNLGLPELAGKSEREFIDISVGLAKDLPRLAELRRGLRERMRASPLMDDAGFARGIEGAYREAWRRWCAARK